MIIAIILLIAVLLIVIWGISTVNGFKKKEIRVQEGLSGVEVALTKRYDMLTKLLDTAKSYMKHENELFAKVIEMRRGMTVDEMNTAQQQMDNLSGRFFAVAEGYPELRSSDNFRALQTSITDVEEDLQAVRRIYNMNVSQFNQMLVTWPDSIVGHIHGHKNQDFFKAEKDKKQDVAIHFFL